MHREKSSLSSAIWSLGLLGLLLCSCSDDNSSSADKPCPSLGIAVEATDGTPCKDVSAEADSEAGKDCRDQVANYKAFQCSAPQICTDQGKWVVYPPLIVDPATAPQSLPFIITNCSTGQNKLTLSKVIIVGDDRCSFSEPEIEEKVIEPGKTSVLRTTYKPAEIGQDFAAIHIYSDAQNHVPLIIPICGQGVAKPAPAPDGGAAQPDSSTGGEPFDCQDVGSEVNTTCHKE